MKNFSIDFCDTTPNPYKVEFNEQGFIIDKTQPTIDDGCFQSDCTVHFGGLHPSKATFYIGVDCEVGCFIQVGDMDINLDLGFTDLYGLKLFLDNLFAMPNESKELRLTSDEIRALLVNRDTKYRDMEKAMNSPSREYKDLTSKVAECIRTFRERGFNDEQLAKVLAFVFAAHETDIMRSLSRTIEYQQYVINELVNTERKAEFIKYVNDCIADGVNPHSLTITNWDEFLEEKLGESSEEAI